MPPLAKDEITENTRINLSAKNAFYILVSVITLVGAILGVRYAAKSDIDTLRSEMKLMQYRIEQLEKKK